MKKSAGCPSSLNTDSKPHPSGPTDTFIRVLRTFNGNQIVSSANGAATTGCSIQRNEVELPCTVYRDEFKMDKQLKYKN